MESFQNALQRCSYQDIILNIPQKHVCFHTEFLRFDCRYIFVDSTFKSNREGLELFALILLFEGEGYPASYLYLDRNSQAYDRKIAIKVW